MKTLVSIVVALVVGMFVVFESVNSTAQPAPPAQLQAMPPGSVISYAGETEPPGWLFCDGRCLDPNKAPQYQPLFQAIKYSHGGDGDRFCLPDLKGRFVRGVDHTNRERQQDPNSLDRASPRPNLSRKGNRGIAVGSIQPWSTALPIDKDEAIRLSAAGLHNHGGGYTVRMNGTDTVHEVTDDSNNEINLRAPDGPLQQAGQHTHDLIGGAKETRPVNVALNFIIKL